MTKEWHRAALRIVLLLIVLGLVFWVGMEYGEMRAMDGWQGNAGPLLRSYAPGSMMPIHGATSTPAPGDVQIW